MDSFLLSSPPDRSYRNSRMMNHGGMGVLYPHPPTPTFSSLPLPYSKQPPLLPLPNPKTYSSLPILPYPPPRNNRGRPRTTNLSTSPPTNKKNTKSSSPKKQDSSDKLGAKSSENAKVLKSSVEVEEGGFEEMGGSIFSLAPPPSSLPLPKFSLKPKVSCNVEAVATASGGIDAGATDDLRKLLHLC